MDLTRIAERLEARFGLGTSPTLRRALYQRLDGLIRAQGEEAYALISEVAADANGKKDPGKYFAFSVVRRLREHGILASIEL